MFYGATEVILNTACENQSCHFACPAAIDRRPDENARPAGVKLSSSGDPVFHAAILLLLMIAARHRMLSLNCFDQPTCGQWNEALLTVPC